MKFLYLGLAIVLIFATILRGNEAEAAPSRSLNALLHKIKAILKENQALEFSARRSEAVALKAQILLQLYKNEEQRIAMMKKSHSK